MKVKKLLLFRDGNGACLKGDLPRSAPIRVGLVVARSGLGSNRI